MQFLLKSKGTAKVFPYLVDMVLKRIVNIFAPNDIKILRYIWDMGGTITCKLIQTMVHGTIITQ